MKITEYTTADLGELLTRYADREVIYMVDNDTYNEDYPSSMGYGNKILIDEYTIEDERVWLKGEEEDDFLEKIEDDIWELEYNEKELSDEEEVELKAKAKASFKSYAWKKAIIVYIK